VVILVIIFVFVIIIYYSVYSLKFLVVKSGMILPTYLRALRLAPYPTICSVCVVLIALVIGEIKIPVL